MLARADPRCLIGKLAGALTASISRPSYLTRTLTSACRPPQVAVRSALLAGNIAANPPRPVSPPLLLLPQLTFTRAYNLGKIIPWERVMKKIYAKETQDRKSKAKNHSEVLKRFRLTRFGWERRRQFKAGRYKRRNSFRQRKKLKEIQYLHRSDFAMIRRCSWSYRLRRTDFPRDGNINLRSAREELGHRFG